MIRFSYDKELEVKLSKFVKNGSIRTIISFLLCAVILMVFFTQAKKHDVSVLLPLSTAVLFATAFCLDLLALSKSAKAHGNLLKISMDVSSDKISGFNTENMEIPNSVHYFELDMCDVRGVQCATPKIGFGSQYETLLIHHKMGTVKISVSDSSKAYHIILNNIKNQ